MIPRPLNKASQWELPKRKGFRLWPRLSPPQLLVGSFLLLILLGTIGFRTLPGLYVDPPLDWLDALFTATSAVCVTGLVVVNTSEHFTWAGQLYLLLLIQLGGLGMIAFTSLIIVALGRRLSLEHEATSLASVEATSHIDRRRLIFDVVRFTFILEGIGALLLFLLWLPDLGFFSALWHGIFQSVSAFCNAGFSTFPDSLMHTERAPLSRLALTLALPVFMLLIVAGGLGFLTLEEIYLRYWPRKARRAFRVSLHSQLVLFTTIGLIVVGWIAFALLEWNITLKDMGSAEKVTNALFMSITPRTAGFNTIDYSQASETTCFLTILFMIIGGSPGSTAGGIKTTTFALLGVVAWSRLRGQRVTSVWGRSVREETVDRTIGLVVVAFAVILVGLLLLTLTQHGLTPKTDFLHRLFEAVSAFNTVGLSMGETDQLSPLAKWTTIVLMFVGRVGTLTFAAALAARYARAGNFRYAYEDVVVG